MSSITQVVHVAEAYGGGVAAAVSDYVLDAPEQRHALVYASRPDAPVEPESVDIFMWRRPLPGGHLRRLRDLRALMRTADPGTAFHAHSSLAGAYVRVAALGLGAIRTVYTPHCYAFERRDLSWPVSRTMYAVEKALALLSPRTVTAACSPRELALSQRLRPGSAGVMVPNIAAPTQTSTALRRPASTRPLLVGAGRLGAQKDPSYFRDCVLALRAAGVEVSARWIGDGDPARRRDLEAATIEVTGWLDRRSLVRELEGADLYLHSGRWEGFPITVLESLTAGCPVLVRDIPSMAGFGFPLLLGPAEDVVGALAAFAEDSTWARVVSQGTHLLTSCSRERQADALRRLYA